ncbi:pyridoxal phosphate-dependent decarboxylase family protein [Nitrosococcus oceani]|uniref:pyridoxal phosphate-dependent decarboxylase family protein n=1 Tax=Nitrosococcus oceani TaxID=1229 RepID=UPI0004E868C9|nr:pyridoxal-dependent decarboxylase [Nitrosococcus oceani]KFI21361.1 amino acid decarboxylase [Nitrosococcus oceani]
MVKNTDNQRINDEKPMNPSILDERLSTLDPSPAQLQKLLDEVGRRLAAFVETIDRQPAQAADYFDPQASWLRESIPETPSAPGEVLDFIFGQVIPLAFNPASPGYLAHVPGGGLFSSAIGELIAATVNRYTGVWAAAPAAVEVETQLLRWLAELMGLPRGSLGLLTSGASMSTLIALVAAREKYLGEHLLKGTVYYSSEAHHMVAKAARVAGIVGGNLRPIQVDGRFRLRVDLLEKTVRQDREQGLLPFFVCGTAGTVNTGAVDPLAKVAAVAAKHELWFHIDGAYGAAFRMVPELQPLFKGMERADSLAMDPHKGLFLAYGTGALLMPDMANLRRAFSASAAYMPAFQESEEHLDFCELSPELSREWRGLRLWLPFKLHGVAAFRHALAEKRRLAVQAWQRLSREPDVEMAAPPELSLFAFRQRFQGINREEENRRNQVLLRRINAPRRIMLTGTEVGGRYFLRICILQLRTHEAILNEGLELILEALAEARNSF